MGEANYSKVKLLTLLNILIRETDEEHPLGASELISLLEAQGVVTERKSIYRDIETLREAGYDVIATRTPKRGYFLGERALQTAEIRLLMDGVLSAGFITPKKSLELTDKLTEQLSRYQAAALKNQLYIDRRIKQQNEEIYYSIDRIHKAVAERKKIAFSYVRRVLNDKGQVERIARTFRVSPYALLWYDDRYYLIGNHEKYDDLMHLRVDRMRQVTLLSEAVRNFEEVSAYRGHFDVADYAQKLSNAFGGQPVTVELACEPHLLEAMFDRFGGQITPCKGENGRFVIRVQMAQSEGLIQELLGFGTGVEVLFPVDLRQKMGQAAASLCQRYSGNP